MTVTLSNESNTSQLTAEKSEKYIREAVEVAHSNALRLALLQLTGDEELAGMRVTKEGVRGGAMQDYILHPDDAAIVKSKAVEYLISHQEKHRVLGNGLPNGKPASAPSKYECAKLMGIFHNEAISQKLCNLGYEELGFDEFPRSVNWTKQPSPEKLAAYHVVIIGAGINGISAAAFLARLGIQFTVIDRQKDVGGTWMENTYPEARVDTIGFTFQYKFVQGHLWENMFPSAPEIRKYLDDTATRHDLKKNMVFEREVVAAEWDESSKKWQLTVKLPDGSTEVFANRPNAVISASGLFSKMNLPEIEGINNYKGHLWHTAKWDHNVEYRGKKVAVIGNGSSGVQVIPHLAREAAELGIYQRTAQWIGPYDGYGLPMPQPLNWLLNAFPYYRNWHAYAGYVRSNQLAPLQVDDPEWRANGGLVNPRNDQLRRDLTQYIKSKVGDDSPFLSKLIPRYAPLVRRLVVDNGFYNALLQDNVELITSSIDRFVPDGIRTKDGVERKFDIVVLACGFQATNYLHPVEYTGRNGVTLDDTWKRDGARSYLGLTIPGYPNFYMMYGPNHQPRGGPAIHSWAEMWSRYIAQCIVWMIESDVQAMDVKQSVYDQYNDRLDEETKKLIWESDGYGYFVNKHGRQAVNLPWTTEDYYDMITRPNMEDYEVTK